MRQGIVCSLLPIEEQTCGRILNTEVARLCIVAALLTLSYSNSVWL